MSNAAWVLDLHSSLLKIATTWHLTVFSAAPSSTPICLLDRALATSSRTRLCLGVNSRVGRDS